MESFIQELAPVLLIAGPIMLYVWASIIKGRFQEQSRRDRDRAKSQW